MSSNARKTLAKEATAADFFEQLLRGLDQVQHLDPKDRWLAYLGLRAMYSEARLARFDRDIPMLKATWKMLEPLLQEFGLLAEFNGSPDLNELLDRFLNNLILVRTFRSRPLGKRRKQVLSRLQHAGSGSASSSAASSVAALMHTPRLATLSSSHSVAQTQQCLLFDELSPAD